MRSIYCCLFLFLIQTGIFADQPKFDPIAVGAIPQSRSWPFPKVIKVKVVVSGRDELASVVKGYLLQDFEKIPDIVIADNNPDYVISVCVVSTTISGIKAGYAMAYVVTSTVNEKIVKSQIAVLKVRGIINSQTEDQMTSWLNNEGVLTEQFVQQTGKWELEEICSENVASINANDFQPYREFLNK